MGTLGRACVVPPDAPRMVSTKHVWTVTLDQNRAEPKWISYWLNFSSLIKDELLGQGTGTAIAGLNGEKIRSLSFPEVPFHVQRRIVAELDALQTKVDALRSAQAETVAELDALLPSILDKAFKGEF
jgi:type I restriction enzyme, S subunit